MSLKNIITISKQASCKLLNILTQSEKKTIRFYVKGGGCNGFNYKLNPTNDEPHKLDEIVKVDSFEIHVCKNSLVHLIGTNIDWTEDIMGNGFTFTNPMAHASCGCGTSFSSKAFN